MALVNQNHLPQIHTMKRIAAVLTTVLFAAAGVEAKPLKVFILAGQSNMEGPASIETFDYLGCAKTFALMGKAFAGAMLEMEKK